jgi:hypothetical protein
MIDAVTGFIQARQIDSFQKLCFLLFLHQHPGASGTSQEFASRLYFGNTPLLERIIIDLCLAGLLDCEAGRFRLRNDPDVRSYLQCLASAFEDPLTRQRILDQLG